MAPPPTSMFRHQKWMHSLKCQQFFSGAGLFLNFMQHFLDVTQIYDLQIFGLKNLFQIGDSPFWCVAQLSSIGFICSELLGWDSCLWCKDLCKALRCREIKREKTVCTPEITMQGAHHKCLWYFHASHNFCGQTFLPHIQHKFAVTHVTHICVAERLWTHQRCASDINSSFGCRVSALL